MGRFKPVVRALSDDERAGSVDGMARREVERGGREASSVIEGRRDGVLT